MRNIFQIAWDRFSTISSIIADVSARVVLVVFYFTILMPFGIGYTLLGDPLQKKQQRASWLQRDPLPTDIDSARQQG